MSALVFVAPPFAGHLYPMLPLARAARDAGYDVEFLTGAAKVETLRKAGFAADTLPALSGGVLEAIANTPEKVGSNPFQLAAQMRQAFAVMGAAKDDLIARWRTKRPHLVVADFIAVPGGLAATALNIPWITTMRTAFALEGRSGPPSYLGGLSPLPGPFGAARDTLGWASVRAGKDMLAALFSRDMRAVGLTRRRADGSEALYSPHAILALELAELEFARDWPTQLRFIGPNADNPEPPPPLDLPPSPRVLVTLGTHLLWAKRDLIAQTHALAARTPGVSFVVALGDAANASATPVHQDARVTAYAYVPYNEHLHRFDAIIHHGGAGVVGAAITAAKPSLVIPHDYDQFDYAARIAHHRLGLRARALDSDDAAAKLRRLLSEDWPALKTFAAHAARYDTAALFLGAVRAVLAGRPPPP